MPRPYVRLQHGAKLRLAGALLAMVTAIAATYFIPGLSHLQPWRQGEDYTPFWNVVGREFLGGAERLRLEQEELGRLSVAAAEAERLVVTAPDAATETSPEMEVPTYPPFVSSGSDEGPEVSLEYRERLRHFFEKLTLVDLKRPGAVARASHWGDSVIGDDGITHAIRERLQGRFGDAGHGFHALARYNMAYIHHGVRFSGRGQWRMCEIIFKCEPDAHYGYAGVSASSSGGGTGLWKTTEAGFGSAFSRFELWYAAMPGGGKFQLKIDGKLAGVIDTQQTTLSDAWHVIDMQDGAHSVEVRAIGDGVARGYGVVLEREGPGIVWDSLALIGAFTQRLDYQEPNHIARQVARRDPDLLVFMLGGNDVQREKMDLYRSVKPYEEEYLRVVRKYRAGKPEASCLLLSLVDHAQKDAQNVIRSRKIMKHLVKAQQNVARVSGCAFYNTYAAMGGVGSAGRWFRARPRLMGADLGHLTSAGHRVIAQLFYGALMAAYREFREAQTGRPLPFQSGNSQKVKMPIVPQALPASGDAGSAAPAPVKDAVAPRQTEP